MITTASKEDAWLAFDKCCQLNREFHENVLVDAAYHYLMEEKQEGDLLVIAYVRNLGKREEKH